MDFLKMVQAGVDKSNQSRIAIAEVDGVFDRVNEDLKNFSLGKLSLVRSMSTMGQVASFTSALAGIDSPHLIHDKITLYLHTDEGKFWEDVAGWKQRAAGYPCVIKFDGQELSCSGEKNLINGISELLASVGFGNAVNKLIKAASDAKARQERAQSAESVDKHALEGQAVATVKPVAAPVAKASSKPRVSKSTAKPAGTDKAQATGAIRPAKKPRATPVATRPAAKSTSKSSGAKTEVGASKRRVPSGKIKTVTGETDKRSRRVGSGE